VKCKEFQEQISAAVDRYLAKVEMDSFVEHAGRCPACRHEYELELTTNLVVHNRARMVRVPPTVQENILKSLDREESPQRGSPFASLLRRPYVKPAVAFAVTAVAVALFVTRPTGERIPAGTPLEASMIGKDVIRQSVSNFHGVLNGSIRPQIVSSEPEELKGFFTGKTEFPVLVPAMGEWMLVGGVVNEHAGNRLAHVVYRHDDTIMYMYQVCWETVQKGEQLDMSAVVREDLLHSGWYTGVEPDGEAIIAWTHGKTLCVAVARMDRARLLTCLRSMESPLKESW
jgi:hypothetical protein